MGPDGFFAGAFLLVCTKEKLHGEKRYRAYESAKHFQRLGEAALLPQPEHTEPDRRGSDHQQRHHAHRFLDVRLHAARSSPPLRRNSALPDPSRDLCVRPALDPDWNRAAAPSTATDRGAARRLSGRRFEYASGAQQRPLYRTRHYREHHDFRTGILQGRLLHGYHDVLWADVPHSDGAGIFGLPEFTALAGRVRRMPHRTGSGLVHTLEALRLASGFRGRVSHL